MATVRTAPIPDLKRVMALIDRLRPLAVEHYGLTGKPLGVNGEIGELEAAGLLGLRLADARQAGYDARDRAGRHITIKTRCPKAGVPLRSQRIGRLGLEYPWHYALLVLLDPSLHVEAIYRNTRTKLEAAIRRPGSKARNERHSLTVGQFLRGGQQVWPKGK